MSVMPIIAVMIEFLRALFTVVLLHKDAGCLKVLSEKELTVFAGIYCIPGRSMGQSIAAFRPSLIYREAG